MKSKDLIGLLKDAETLKTRAANLYHNIKLKRVSHTLKSVIALARGLTKLHNATEDSTKFLKDLSYALYQSQSGPTEIEVHPGRKVFIQGTFDLEELRTYLLVSTPVDTILLDVAEPGK